MGNCCCLNNTGTLTEDTLCGDFSFSLASGGVGTATIFQAPGKTGNSSQSPVALRRR